VPSSRRAVCPSSPIGKGIPHPGPVPAARLIEKSSRPWRMNPSISFRR